MDVGIILLAGGKSSRMGTNKALLPIAGQTQIERICSQCQQVSSHLILVTNDEDAYSFLGLPMVNDRYPGCGPLAGIQIGLEVSSCDWNIVAACDMPFVTAGLLRFLREEALQAAGMDAVVPLTGGQLQPLLAVYRKRCGSLFDTHLSAGRLRMAEALESLQVKPVTEADFPPEIDPGVVFFNMNSLADWELAKRALEQDPHDTSCGMLYTSRDIAERGSKSG